MKKIAIILGLFVTANGFAQPLPETEVVVEEMEECEETEPTIEAVQQSFESVLISAFKSGNSSKIASYFGDNVDMSILDKENLYSKSQGEQVLKGFFTKHKPSNFSVLHKGKSGQSQYFIGELTASDGKYRVTINSKPSGSTNTITSITIEKS